ncbi:fluoride efflux transporter CrcB [Lactiplantibacillus mudanjiangensis]|uniref:Fluoride-specific ion channel FluC n=1 Tax=Lactiplantibacillus mudanjiangensis TaxID=1296538 RepID=A0A660E1L7_9LACO|nr:fluoride efflux transporter CrcB [Lactiplantibacillus mudanjiangensis]VDG21150.1 chromosome condensation protein CrcB [Lactobacillus sp.] [Lactiplantibacillus mudanjiangensis]VDG22914.1 chromosome condensation protein CrcB [Lactobacillus sp.] [Lactiplantibacillus mudanjiangensis]VDG29226.1 chromosome condensation protein CrcB [Lactobacillus sp.] [Lactiplantibacillus mudanjiangensis]VDG31753.1 chromosome condensation protein CrcB [Lactobacillus sp.] [Lactiplantibacillus mudanjiangensis]
MWELIGLVSSGATLGALTRYSVMRLARPLNQRLALPVATLGINLVGALLLGWDMTSSLSANWQLFLGTGIMGGLTTFSTMINEIVLLARNGRLKTAGSYLGLSLIGGLAMVWLGTLL